jgi:hypothetical protein
MVALKKIFDQFTDFRPKNMEKKFFFEKIVFLPKFFFLCKKTCILIIMQKTGTFLVMYFIKYGLFSTRI